jgi:SPP1 gp7 family putative phage head morphogenesis protein
LSATYGAFKPVAIAPPELKKLLEKIIRDIWQRKGMPADINKQLTEFFASKYWEGVEKGWEIDLENVDFNTPDEKMLAKLEESVYQFASAKNYQQLKAISQALIDEQGKLRNFSAFRRAAAEINNEFVNQWLEVEYNYAVASSQMASRWQRIEATKETLPLLEYMTVGDDRVRLEHQELEGITLPVDDEFWNSYYPPNGWNCRCDVMQHDTGTITNKDTIVYPEKMPDMFKYNSGKADFVFPKNHPYYDGLPGDVKLQADKLWKENGKTL